MIILDCMATRTVRGVYSHCTKQHNHEGEHTFTPYDISFNFDGDFALLKPELVKKMTDELNAMEPDEPRFSEEQVKYAAWRTFHDLVDEITEELEWHLMAQNQGALIKYCGKPELPAAEPQEQAV